MWLLIIVKLMSDTKRRCFTLVVFAQLALVSPQLLPPQFMDIVLDHMNKFLSETQPEVVKTYEQDQDCVWATLLPYVKLFYLPPEQLSAAAASYDTVTTYRTEQLGEQISEKGVASSQMEVVGCNQELPPENSSQKMLKLRQVSERIILFFLHSKMSRKYSCDIIVKEDLVDYITTLPWHVSMESRVLAKAVVSELGAHLKLQPPSLCSIVKAKLARMHFGLERVVGCDSAVDLIHRLYMCHNVAHQ